MGSARLESGAYLVIRSGVKKRNLCPQPSRIRFSVFRGLIDPIPPHLVGKLARKHKLSARCFTVWSQVVAMVFAQVSRARSLNEVCDALRLYPTQLKAMRQAGGPARNTLSHANRKRDCAFAEDLFWEVLKHLQEQAPGFGSSRRSKLGWRFKRAIQVVDATVIILLCSCLDWANYRRQKAAAKVHLRMDWHSMLPNCVIIDKAREPEVIRARELCAGLRKGEIALFDKGYTDFGHYADLHKRGVFFVTRAKEDLHYTIKKRSVVPKPTQHVEVIEDVQIVLSSHPTRKLYSHSLRRVRAKVVLEGRTHDLVFLTNNLTWSAHSVADLYRCRWQIEVFFKQLKQTLQLTEFLGQSKNAVSWQIWMALLTYVLVRYQQHLSRWKHSFTRLVALIRAALWRYLNIAQLVQSIYGTARRTATDPPSSWLPGLQRYAMGQHL